MQIVSFLPVHVGNIFILHHEVSNVDWTHACIYTLEMRIQLVIVHFVKFCC